MCICMCAFLKHTQLASWRLGERGWLAIIRGIYNFVRAVAVGSTASCCQVYHHRHVSTGLTQRSVTLAVCRGAFGLRHLLINELKRLGPNIGGGKQQSVVALS